MQNNVVPKLIDTNNKNNSHHETGNASNSFNKTNSNHINNIALIYQSSSSFDFFFTFSTITFDLSSKNVVLIIFNAAVISFGE